MPVLGQCPACGHEKHTHAKCYKVVDPELAKASFLKYAPGTAWMEGMCPCDPSQSAKADAGKHRGYSMIPYETIGELADVYAYGAEKYERESWRKVPDAKERYTDAMMRHLGKALNGEVNDPESGKRHLAHALWNLVAVMELTR